MPRAWIKANCIKKGEEVDVSEKSGSIIIKREKETKQIKAFISLNEYGSFAKRVITALFKSGCDEINISYETNSDIEIIDNILNEMIGFEIVQQNENRCVLKEISNPEQEEFDLIFRRTILVVKEIADECVESLKKNNAERWKTLIKRDIVINKLSNFCRRLLNKKGYREPMKTPLMYHIVEEIEKLGDEYRDLAKYILDSNVPSINPKIILLLEKINSLLRLLYDIFIKFKPDKVRELSEKQSDVNKELNSFLNTNSIIEVRILSSYACILRIIFNLVGPLLTMKMMDIQTEVGLKE